MLTCGTRLSRLTARTVPLDDAVDLLDVAGDDGLLFEPGHGTAMAGRGVALRLPIGWDEQAVAGSIASRLGTVSADGPLPPVALGALPFSRSGGGELVVPTVLVRRSADGAFWLTVTAPDLEASAVEEIRRGLTGASRRPSAPGPRHYQVRSATDPMAWCRTVADAAEAVAAGRMAKVVLARDVTVVSDRPLRPSAVARHLRSSQPGCTVFAVDGFIGASPELLVERRGRQVRSLPLAGTAARHATGTDDGGAGLLSSSKDREEHRLVVVAVTEALAPFCEELRVPRLPSVVPVGGLVHLGTSVDGRLRQPVPDVLRLVDALHPTPAVGGTPTAAALDYIAEVERLDRGRYAGPVGWVDATGDGCWVVGIRSAQITGCSARLLAGAGVVAGSDPDAELAETELKLQPMLAAIVRP